MQVLPDLSGRRALVTGGTSGIGLEIVRSLAGAGAHVLLPVRDRGRASSATADLRSARIELRDLDLASLASTRALATTLLAEGQPIDLVVFNAGIALLGDRSRHETADGFELHFQTNFLGHAVLARALLPLLTQSASRLVVQGSLASAVTGVRWRDLQFTHRYRPLAAYGSSKTALSAFALALAHRAPQLTVHLSHPGVVPATHIAPTLRGRAWPGLRDVAVRRLGHPPAHAALPALMALTTDVAAPASFAPSGAFQIAGPPAQRRPFRRVLRADGARLWRLTDSLADVAPREQDEGMAGEQAREPALRPATERDAARIAAVWESAWRDGHVGHIPDELLVHRRTESFVTRTRDMIDRTTVAEVDGVVVGFVTLHGDELEQLFVDRSARGTGVAARLLAHGADRLRAEYAQPWLAVVEGNARARRFYEREGWRDAGPVDYQARIENGAVTVPCRRYELALGPA